MTPEPYFDEDLVAPPHGRRVNGRVENWRVLITGDRTDVQGDFYYHNCPTPTHPNGWYTNVVIEKGHVFGTTHGTAAYRLGEPAP
jgi:hypothetical protein